MVVVVVVVAVVVAAAAVAAAAAVVVAAAAADWETGRVAVAVNTAEREIETGKGLWVVDVLQSREHLAAAEDRRRG